MIVAGAAQALEGAVFQNLQQLGLHAGRHVGDFVQEESAAAGAFEQAFFAAAGVGEGARLVAEQLAFQQCVGQGGAVQLQQGAVCTRGVVVDSLGGHALSGTAFSLDQDGSALGFGGLAHQVDDLLHGRAFSHDRVYIVAALGRFHGIADAHAQGQHLGGTADGVDHVGEVERLDQIIVGAQLHGFHRALHHVVGAHHDDDGGGVFALDLAQHFDAVNAGQHHVQQGQVGFFGGKNLHGFLAAHGDEHFEALLAQRPADGAEREGLVVHDQDGVGH